MAILPSKFGREKPRTRDCRKHVLFARPIYRPQRQTIELYLRIYCHHPVFYHTTYHSHYHTRMRLEDEIIEDSEDEELFAPLAIPRPTTRGGETGRESARGAYTT